MAFHVQAPAKLNLSLRVVGRRADGYHLLSTLFQAIDFCDELAAAPADRDRLTVAADHARATVPATDDNLVLRAVRAFRSEWPALPPLRLHLRKRIPAGAGLGGGSSDAAAALRLCAAFTAIPDPARLHQIARTLGADVPFFLRGGTQWGRGVGDELQVVPDPPPAWFVLLLPPYDCPTAEVYKNFAVQWNEAAAAGKVSGVTTSPIGDSALQHGTVNDLEPAAMRVRPQMGHLRDRVCALGHPSVRMSGSGSSWFVAFADAAACGAAAKALSVLRDEEVRVLTATAMAGLPPLREGPAPEEG